MAARRGGGRSTARGAGPSTRTEWMEELLGPGALGGAVATPLELHHVTERRLRARVLDHFMRIVAGASRAELLDTFGLAERTVARRKREGLLSIDESDRVLRVARVAAQAADVLGDLPTAAAWLVRPNRSLGGVTPLSLVRSDAGTEAVVDVLGRIDHGIAG